MSSNKVGIMLDNGCRITHGDGANVKKPFSDIDLTMHEMSPSNKNGFRGQFGVIEFTSDLRLPRHIHMDAAQKELVDERILVLNGVGLVELAGKIWAVAPSALVDIVGGVPHTWTACPANVKLPDGTVSEGKFTMVYEYEEPTAFYPTESTVPISNASEYLPLQTKNFDGIRFPELTARQIAEQASVVLHKKQHDGLALA